MHELRTFVVSFSAQFQTALANLKKTHYALYHERDWFKLQIYASVISDLCDNAMTHSLC